MNALWKLFVASTITVCACKRIGELVKACFTSKKKKQKFHHRKHYHKHYNKRYHHYKKQFNKPRYYNDNVNNNCFKWFVLYILKETENPTKKGLKLPCSNSFPLWLMISAVVFPKCLHLSSNLLWFHFFSSLDWLPILYIPSIQLRDFD